jgi:hypothetical protein
MAKNPDLRCSIFHTNLGPLPKEGFYTEVAYKQVTLSFYFILTNKLFYDKSPKLKKALGICGGTGDSTEEEEVPSDNKAEEEKKAEDSEDSGLA